MDCYLWNNIFIGSIFLCIYLEEYGGVLGGVIGLISMILLYFIFIRKIKKVKLILNIKTTILLYLRFIYT